MFMLGFSTMIAQIVMIREFISVVGGNELIIGIFFFNWLLITGLGAWISKFFKKFNYNVFVFFTQLWMGILPLLIVFYLIYLKNFIFQPGIALNTSQTFFVSFIFLLPYCLITGMAFPVYASLTKKQIDISVSISYAIETLGGVLGGVVFTFLIAGNISSINTLIVLTALCLLIAAIWFIFNKKLLLSVTCLLIISVVILFIPPLKLERIALSSLYPKHNIIASVETLYGKFIITELNGQYNVYQNGMPLFIGNNVIADEEIIHFAMIQKHNVRNVLLIEGGSTRALSEIIKYNVQNITYTCIDPFLIKIAYIIRNIPFNKDIKIIQKDGRLFINTIKENNQVFDVIIINVPEPLTASNNRFFTIEFLQKLHKISRGGVIILPLPPTVNYINEEEILLNSVIYKTLKSVFKNVEVIPASRNYFIASDSNLYRNVSELITLKNINNFYVKYYIDDQGLQERSNFIKSKLNPNVPLNYDFHPVAYFKQIQLWVKKTSFNNYIYVVFFIILFFIVISLKNVSLGVFAAGFSLSSYQLVFLLAFQALYGYVYSYIGLLTALGMLGLVIGSFYGNKLNKQYNFKQFVTNQIILTILILILAVIFKFNDTIHIIPTYIITCLAILAIVISYFVGFQFAVSTKLIKSNTYYVAANLYSADLFGSCLGALVTPLVLIPLLGFAYTCVVISLFNLICLIIIIFFKNKI